MKKKEMNDKEIKELASKIVEKNKPEYKPPMIRMIACRDCKSYKLEILWMEDEQHLILRCQSCGGVSRFPIIYDETKTIPQPEPIKNGRSYLG